MYNVIIVPYFLASSLLPSVQSKIVSSFIDLSRVLLTAFAKTERLSCTVLHFAWAYNFFKAIVWYVRTYLPKKYILMKVSTYWERYGSGIFSLFCVYVCTVLVVVLLTC